MKQVDLEIKLKDQVIDKKDRQIYILQAEIEQKNEIISQMQQLQE
jgi:hypothetical protein